MTKARNCGICDRPRAKHRLGEGHTLICPTTFEAHGYGLSQKGHGFCNDHGNPFLSDTEQCDALAYCLAEKHYEDARSHLRELAERVEQYQAEGTTD